MKPVFIVLVLCFGPFLLSHNQCNRKMNKDFCQALKDNDQLALQKSCDTFLKSISAADGLTANTDHILQWLSSHDCVESATVDPSLLDTEPSVQLYNVAVKTADGQLQARSFGVKLFSSGYRFDTK